MRDLFLLWFAAMSLILGAAFTLDYYDLKCSVRSNQRILQELKEAERPMVVVSGKYPHVITSRKEVLVKD